MHEYVITYLKILLKNLLFTWDLRLFIFFYFARINIDSKYL